MSASEQCGICCDMPAPFAGMLLVKEQTFATRDFGGGMGGAARVCLHSYGIWELYLVVSSRAATMCG